MANEGHCHDHHQHHHHERVALQSFSKAFIIAIVANASFVIVQFLVGFLAHSTSLLADALHNLGDVLSLVLGFVANLLLKRGPTQKTTYGMKKISILVSLINGLLLVFTSGMIVLEALYKLFFPVEIITEWVIVTAAVGIIVNGSTALLFMKGSEDLNIKAAFLHLAYDALISFAVVVGAVLIYFIGWLVIDPILSFLIAFIIIKGTWSLFKDSFRLLIDGVPTQISLMEVKKTLLEIEGVQDVHDLHIWALSTQENALSVHLWMPSVPLTDLARLAVEKILKTKHNIHHTTIQVELFADGCEDNCATKA